MIDPDRIEGKARMFAEWEDRLTFFDSLILCRFYRDLYQWEQLAEMVKGVTGLDLDTEKMRSIAGAISDATRHFNLREGLTPEDDKLPKRFYDEPLPAVAMSLLDQYNVRYIVVGPLERAYYVDTGLAKFERMAADGLLQVVFDNGEVTIYEVVE